MEAVPLLFEEDGFAPKPNKSLIVKILNALRISTLEEDLIKSSRVLRYVLMHERVILQSEERAFAFYLDVGRRKLVSPKMTLCEKVELDTANDRKVWFKGTDVKGHEFYLKLTMNDGKLLSGGKRERYTIVVQ
ncbi:hypothetical protein A9K97_gp097 [Tokyovirus A1]|uniref:hypothetical protein n=1 Tax=Tokyovirus A1 TaxID=1826170 RepID=UPI0007A987E8|nr:hypothetical protein A9K97_gp097 [Tokyovirus A1]BAU80254.1 hypothetical protein [Tokyovirus A1]